MYAAKQAGGHRYQWFDADHDRRARDYREMLQQVRKGLAAGEFRLYYQPKVDMRRGVVFGAEALIRWQHPDEGLFPRVRFIPRDPTRLGDYPRPVGTQRGVAAGGRLGGARSAFAGQRQPLRPPLAATRLWSPNCKRCWRRTRQRHRTDFSWKFWK